MRYLVSAKWWESWRDFTNFEQDYLFGNCEDPESLNNDCNSSVLYGKPDIITNAELLLNEQAKSSCGKLGRLKPDLTLLFDYVYVPKEVWQHLYSWYSADYVIHRPLRRAESYLGKRAKYVIHLDPELDQQRL